MTGRQSMFENVTITLEHDIDEQYQYQPGEIIRGKIGINLHRRTLVQTVYITITGEGRCSWEDDYMETFQSIEHYIDATQIIFDSSDKGSYLDEGFHDFQFEYLIPDNIPSSFIGKFGSITYILKATVQGAKTGDTTIATEPFLVTRKSPLPPASLHPVDKKLAKQYFSLCSWGKVELSMALGKTGYVPGEDLNVQAEVQNRSPLRVTAIQAAIMMDSVYRSKKDIIPYRQIVNKRRDDYELVQGDGRRWQGVRLAIPPYIPESKLDYCDIIEVSYLFQFRVELSGGKEIKIEVPLTIGANPRGLELPGDQDSAVNKHWTVGPKSLAKQQLEMHADQDEGWNVVAPEFRQENAQVNNPLFRNDSHHERHSHRDRNSQHDRPHRHSSSKHHEFDDISHEKHRKKEHTKL